ncbi:MAG: hypothetical protein ACTMKU_01505, partial [Actinomycetaceae bacterium]
GAAGAGLGADGAETVLGADTGVGAETGDAVERAEGALGVSVGDAALTAEVFVVGEAGSAETADSAESSGLFSPGRIRSSRPVSTPPVEPDSEADSPSATATLLPAMIAAAARLPVVIHNFLLMSVPLVAGGPSSGRFR